MDIAVGTKPASSAEMQAKIEAAIVKFRSAGADLPRADLLRELTTVSRALLQAPELADAASRSGLMGAVGSVLQRTTDDPSAVDIIASALLAMAAVVDFDDYARTSAVNVPAEVCESVVDAFRRYLDERAIVKQACRAVERLSRRDGVARQLASSGVAELLVEAARRHRRHEDTIAAVCDAGAWGDTPGMHDALVAAGWPAAVVSLSDARVSTAHFSSTVGPALAECTASQHMHAALIDAGAREAVLALANRSAEPLLQHIVVVVLEQLSSGPGVTREIAAAQIGAALQSLDPAGHADNHVLVVVPKTLAGKLASPRRRPLRTSARACVLIAASLKHVHAQDVPAGLAQKLVVHLGKESHATVHAAACEALTALASMRSWELASSVVARKGIPKLLQLIKSSELPADDEGIKVRCRAAEALAALSQYKQAAPALVSGDACSVLAAALAANSESPLSKPVMQALHTILTHEPSATGRLAHELGIVEALGRSVRGATSKEWFQYSAPMQAASFCVIIVLQAAIFASTEVSSWCAVIFKMIPRIVTHPLLAWLLCRHDAWKWLAVLFALGIHDTKFGPEGLGWICSAIHAATMWWFMGSSALGALGLALAAWAAAALWALWLAFAIKARVLWSGSASVAASSTTSACTAGLPTAETVHPSKPSEVMLRFARLSNPRFVFSSLLYGSDTSAPGVPKDVREFKQEKEADMLRDIVARDEGAALQLLLVQQLAAAAEGRSRLLDDNAFYWVRRAAEVRGYGGMTAVAACLAMANLVQCDAAVLQPQLAKVHQMLVACLQPPPQLLAAEGVAPAHRASMLASGGVRAQRALAALRCTLALVRAHEQFNGQLFTSGVVAAAVTALRTYGLANAALAASAAGAGGGSSERSKSESEADAAMALSVRSSVTAEAARLIALLCGDDASCSKLLAAGAVDALAEALASPHAATSSTFAGAHKRSAAACCKAIRQVTCFAEGSRAAAAHAAGEQRLLRQLTSVARLRSAALAVHACGAIRNIGAAAEHRPALMRAGAGQALLFAMHRLSASREIVWSAMGALFGLCCDERNCAELQAAGAAAAAVAALQHTQADAHLAWAASGVLLRLAQAAVAALDEHRLLDLSSQARGAEKALLAAVAMHREDARVVRAAGAALQLLQYGSQGTQLPP